MNQSKTGRLIDKVLQSSHRVPIPQLQGLLQLPPTLCWVGCVLISGATGRRSAKSQKILAELTKLEWGLLILDEVLAFGNDCQVHVVPAQMFRRVVTTTHVHTRLGLTATLVREDEKITDLNFLIGYDVVWGLAQLPGLSSTRPNGWSCRNSSFLREFYAPKCGARCPLRGPSNMKSTSFC